MTKIEIKDYLENYQEKKAVAEYKRKHGIVNDRTLVCLTAIEECIEGLPNGLNDILKMHYFQKVSLREMGKKFYLGRTAVARRRDKAIDIITDCLKEL